MLSDYQNTIKQQAGAQQSPRGSWRSLRGVFGLLDLVARGDQLCTPAACCCRPTLGMRALGADPSFSALYAGGGRGSYLTPTQLPPTGFPETQGLEARGGLPWGQQGPGWKLLRPRLGWWGAKAWILVPDGDGGP